MVGVEQFLVVGGVVEWFDWRFGNFEAALWLLVLEAMMTAKMWAMMTASLDLLLLLPLPQ